MKLRTATVLFPAGKVFASNYVGKPNRQSIKLKDNKSQDEFAVWFTEGDKDHCALVRGAVVQIVEEAGRCQICFPDGNSPAPTAIAPVPAPTATQPMAAPTAPRPIAAPTATPAILASPVEPVDFERPMSDQQRAKLFSILCVRAKILRTCHVQMQTLFTDEQNQLIVSEATIQRYAIALFSDLRSTWQ